MNIKSPIKVLALSFLLLPTGLENMQAQVTIGSQKAPIVGSLLDLKEETITTKGLGLPRVKLVSNSSLEPCLPADLANDPDERSLHIGLVVYNVGNEIHAISTASDKRFCKGTHIWNGDKWVPLTPYPTWPNTIAGPREDLVDKRGPSESEINTYSTAYFYSVVNPNLCDANNTKNYLDEGIWMTENLRTQYMPGSATKIDRHNADQHNIPQYIEPKYTGIDAERIRQNGLLYNWAAATNIKDPNRELTNGEYTTVLANDHARVEGICPDGWHLPSYLEWMNLIKAIKAQKEKYSVDNTVAWALPLKDQLETGPTIVEKGTSKLAKDGGIAMLLIGAAIHQKGGAYEYGEAAYYWTGTGGAIDTSAPLNGRGYRAKYSIVELSPGSSGTPTGSYNTISTEHFMYKSYSYSSRVYLYSVRCKKDNSV